MESDLGVSLRRDIAPGTDHLDRLAVLVADQMPFVVDPAVNPVSLEEAVFDSMATLLEQLVELSLHPGELVGMHATAPEVGALEIVVGLVSQQVLHIVADEGRSEVAARLETIDNRGGGHEHVNEAILRCDKSFTDMLAGSDVAPGA